MQKAADILRKEGYTPSPSSTDSPSNAGDGGSNEGGSPDKDKLPGGDGAQNIPTPPSIDEVPDEDEATLLRKLQKKGINVSSLSELKPAEKVIGPTEAELQQQEADRQANIRMYGLREKIVTTSDLDQFAADTKKDTADLAFEAWVEDEYGDTPVDKRPSQQDLADEFNESFYQFASEDDPKRLRAEKKMQKIAQQYLKQKYGHVYGLESRFNENLELQSQRSAYNATVDEAFQAVGNTIDFEIPTGKDGKQIKKIPFKILPEDLAPLREQFLSDDTFALLGKTKKDKEYLVNAIRSGFIAKRTPEIVAYVAKVHGEAMAMAAEKGLRGLPLAEDGSEARNPGDAIPTNIKSKAILERNKQLL
jgi:hypothetical protein